jgi:glutamyl-tRNA synthetase
MKEVVRTRFAPSPTGYLHIGGARTALFNVLFTLQNHGEFFIRIEDTDLERSSEAYTQNILESLKWLGLDDYKGGIAYQSKRISVYRDYARRLLNEGKAYKCYCTPKELEAIRKEQMKARKPPKYPGICREGRPERELKGLPFALRFKTPKEGETSFQDIVKGTARFQNAELEDFVLLRSDNTPTYNLCVVVDDYEMGITHIIRGDDHFVNTSKQILLYKALGLPVSRFAHVPMILGADRQRLSKRHGATSAQAYKEMGYFPQALVNYLARLGWSCGDQEVFSFEELVQKFRLEDVGKSPAVFNPQKLLWLNHTYMKTLPKTVIAEQLLPFMKERGIEADSEPRLWLRIETLRERSKTLLEMAEWMKLYYTETIEYDPKAKERYLKPEILPALKALLEGLESQEGFDEDGVKRVFSKVLEAYGLSLGELAQPLRVVLTGGTVSPGIFEVIVAMGKAKVLKRLQEAVALIH